MGKLVADLERLTDRCDTLGGDLEWFDMLPTHPGLAMTHARLRTATDGTQLLELTLTRPCKTENP